jgi:hypothetical protein
MKLPGYPVQVCFWMLSLLRINASLEQVWTLRVRPVDIPSISSDYVKSAGGGRDNPKTVVVVRVVGIVVVPVSGTTVLRIVVPRTAAQSL